MKIEIWKWDILSIYPWLVKNNTGYYTKVGSLQTFIDCVIVN